MTSLLDASPDPLLTLEPHRRATVREIFGVDSDMTVPVFTERDSHVPEIDEAYRFVKALGVPVIRAPQEDGWAPGYYSLLFEDPDGVRLEINHVPGKGVFDTEDKAVNPVYPKSRP